MSLNAQVLAFAGSSTSRKEMLMQFDHLNPESEDAVRHLETEGHYRVLRAVPKPFSSMPDNGATPPGRCVAIVDMETSGLDPDRDKIIEPLVPPNPKELVITESSPAFSTKDVAISPG